MEAFHPPQLLDTINLKVLRRGSSSKAPRLDHTEEEDGRTGARMTEALEAPQDLTFPADTLNGAKVITVLNGMSNLEEDLSRIE